MGWVSRPEACDLTPEIQIRRSALNPPDMQGVPGMGFLPLPFPEQPFLHGVRKRLHTCRTAYRLASDADREQAERLASHPHHGRSRADGCGPSRGHQRGPARVLDSACVGGG